jgi:hypothetical protein
LASESKYMLRANAFVVLAVFALSACGSQNVEPTIGPGTGAPTTEAPTPYGQGPFVFPTHLTFSSPQAPPKTVLVGQGLGFISEECQQTGEEIAVTLSGPRPGPDNVLLVFIVTPHAKGQCTVIFYNKYPPYLGTALNVTVD